MCIDLLHTVSISYPFRSEIVDNFSGFIVINYKVQCFLYHVPLRYETVYNFRLYRSESKIYPCVDMTEFVLRIDTNLSITTFNYKPNTTAYISYSLTYEMVANFHWFYSYELYLVQWCLYCILLGYEFFYVTSNLFF